MRATDHETRQGYRLITRMNAVPTLEREAEVKLCRRYLATGDGDARERVIASSMRHVVPLALRYRYYGVALVARRDGVGKGEERRGLAARLGQARGV